MLPQGGAVAEQATLAGPMVVGTLGRLEEVKPDGTGRQTLSAEFPPATVLPARAGAPLVALGGGAVVKIDRNGTVTSLTPGGFQAGGAARRGDDVLACGRRPLPPGERSAARAAGRDQTTAAPALLLPGTTGRATVLALGCPVSWAAAADVVAGAGGPQVAYRRTTRGASVLAGPHGGPLGLTVSLRAVTSFAVAVASAGAMYLRAAGESVLSDRLGSAPPSASGLGVAQRVAGKRDLRGLDATLRAAMPALPPLEVPVTQLETAEPTALGRPGSTQPARTRQTARLVSRSGLCQHLVVVRGRCPGPTSLDAPAEAAISERAAAKLHMGVGDALDAAALGANGVARQAKVITVYRPTPDDPWWWGSRTVGRWVGERRRT